MSPRRQSVIRWATATLLCCAAGVPCQAQPAGGLPGDVEGVGLDEQLDAELPLDLEFVDEDGRPVRLAQYFDGERPVLLSLVYFECPMLCTLVLDGLVAALRDMDWVPGQEFEVVTLSIDPAESSALARLKKQNYVESYGKPAAAPGWHFLTGGPREIRTLADAVGFRYRFLEDSGEFAHPAVLVLLTPQGRISRYLTGVRHDPRTLRLSLVEAGEGKIGSPLDKFLLYCYRYDAEQGRYAPVAMNIMRAGGALTMLLLGAVLIGFWRRELRRRRPA